MAAARAAGLPASVASFWSWPVRFKARSGARRSFLAIALGTRKQLSPIACPVSFGSKYLIARETSETSFDCATHSTSKLTISRGASGELAMHLPRSVGLFIWTGDRHLQLAQNGRKEVTLIPFYLTPFPKQPGKKLL